MQDPDQTHRLIRGVSQIAPVRGSRPDAVTVTETDQGVILDVPTAGALLTPLQAEELATQLMFLAMRVRDRLDAEAEQPEDEA